jgi:outer membrane protein OmpA-like peptidoglycan-associated protein
LDTEQIGFTLSTGIVQDDVDALLVLTASPVPAPPATLDPTYARELVRRQALGEATTAFRGAKIRFDENRAVFASGSEGPLLTVLQELRRDPRLRLLVKAFADPGEPAAMTLSERRAARVVEWLVTRGVEPKRLVPRGCGTLRPLDFGTTPAGRSMNRRVELVRLSATAGCEPPW